MRQRSELHDAIWREVEHHIDAHGLDWPPVDDYRTRRTLRRYESPFPWCHYQMEMFLGRHPQVQVGVYDNPRMVLRFFDYATRHLTRFEAALGERVMLKEPGAARSAQTRSNRGTGFSVEAPMVVETETDIGPTAEWLVEKSIALRAAVGSSLDLAVLDFD